MVECGRVSPPHEYGVAKPPLWLNHLLVWSLLMSDITLHSTERELEAVRARLQATRGKQFWRSLDELADTPAFHELLHREFPAGAAELSADPVNRRTFLKLMGASLALAGLSGCTVAIRQPQEKVAPYARAPYDQRPGVPNFYATALSRDGFGLGVAVKSYDGRPIKVEGNPNHPASLGASDLFAQAEILQIYDPARPETVLRAGSISTWDLFVNAFTPVMQIQRALQGQGLRILTPTVTSPTLAAQFNELLTALPNARWVQYDPVGRSNTYAGTREAFGEPPRATLPLRSGAYDCGPRRRFYGRRSGTRTLCPRLDQGAAGAQSDLYSQPALRCRASHFEYGHCCRSPPTSEGRSGR